MMYKITHQVTGETHTGSMRELADVLGVFPSTISRSATTGTSVKNWSVDKLPDEKVKVKEDYSIPLPLLIAWDEVTAPFKVASARKRARGSGEQKCRVETCDPHEIIEI